MTRKEEREETFKLVFESQFNNYSVEDTIENAKECRDLELSEDSYAIKLFRKTIEEISNIDDIISKHLKNWKTDRIAKAALAILRISVCEIYYFDEIPDSVSINEAVEIAKIYCGEDDPSFINGVLGSVVRNKK